MKSLQVIALSAASFAFLGVASSQPPPKKPGLGSVLPPFVREGLDLTPDQLRQISELENEVRTKLLGILNEEQQQRAQELFRKGPPDGKKGGPKKKNEDPVGMKLEAPRDLPGLEQAKPGPSSFHPNVKVSFTERYMIVESDGIPTHETAKFPNEHNPNKILKQNYRFIIPRQPKKAETTTPLPMGPIGVALNGIPFYNPYNAHGKNAVEGPFAEVFDSCCGHPDPMGRYHYHKYPICLHNPFKTKEKPGGHSALIGYAFDGFPIYGPNGPDGKPPGDLDECNGRFDAERGYHYHVTDRFPYILGAYRGVVEGANFDRKGPPKKK